MPRNYTPRVTVTCAQCGRSFTKPPSAISAGRGLYCSKACQNAAMSTAPLLTCETCGKTFRRKQSLVRKRTFCSIPCRSHRPPAPAILSDDGLTANVPLQARDGTITGYTVVDAADVAWAQQWRWQLSPDGRAARGAMGRTHYLHRDLLAITDGTEVDHINRDTLDNRRSNLRGATRAENAQNLPPRSGTTSKYRGVAWSKASGKWQAYAQVNRKRLHLGFFTDEEAAANAARAARSHMMPFSND